MSSNRHIRHRRGFSTAEVTMSALIVGILMAAALNCSGAAVRSQLASGENARGALFASALLAEILEQPFQNPDGASVFGPESGEASTTRANFDDVDDYHNWSSTPQKKDGTAFANSIGYVTSVEVTYGNPDDLSDGTTATGTTNVKRIKVRAWKGSKNLATMHGVVTK